MPAIICFHIFTASFVISKIWPVLRLRLFQPRFHVNSDGRETNANIFDFLEFYASKVFFKIIIRKHMLSLLPHKMKSLNKTFTLVSAGFETCQDRQRRLLLDEKVVMWQSRDMLSYHVNTQIVGRYMIIIFSEGFGALQWKKMKFEVKFCLSLVSMLSAILWYEAPFISLAVRQFGTTWYWSFRISRQTFSVGWVERNSFLLGLVSLTNMNNCWDAQVLLYQCIHHFIE